MTILSATGIAALSILHLIATRQRRNKRKSANASDVDHCELVAFYRKEIARFQPQDTCDGIITAFDQWMKQIHVDCEKGSAQELKMFRALAEALCNIANSASGKKPAKPNTTSIFSRDSSSNVSLASMGWEGNPVWWIFDNFWTTPNLVNWNGVSVEWFLSTFMKAPEMQTFQKYGCRMWFIRNYGIVEILKWRGVTDGCVVDHLDKFENTPSVEQNQVGERLRQTPLPAAVATAFISFTGSYTLDLFTELVGHSKLKGKYFWTDTICVNQFEWNYPTVPRLVRKMKAKFLHDLRKKIQVIGYTTLFLDRWDDWMSTLGKIWVLWEIFATVDSSPSALQVLFRNSELDRFVDEGLSSHKGLAKTIETLSVLDVRKAISYRKEDRELILSLMKEDGLFNVNSRVSEALREWAAGTGEQALLACSESARLVLSNNLALLYSDLGRLDEAEVLLTKVMEESRERRGHKHVDTLTDMNNLASVKNKKGDYLEAEKLLREVLAAYRDVFGAQHPSTLTGIRNLGIVLQEQGRYEEAETLLRAALSGHRKVFGEYHPHSFDSVDGLGLLLQKRGKYSEAEAHHRQSLQGRCEVLGDRHPDTLMSLDNLGTALLAQGNNVEAEKLFRELVLARREMLGNKHIDTLTSINNLALAVQRQERYAESEALHRESVAACREMLGMQHAYTFSSISNLASVLNDRGNYEDSESLLREALDCRRKVLGSRHPSTISSLNNLAVVLGKQGKYAEQEKLYRLAVVLLRKVLGRDHPNTLFAACNLAVLLVKQGNHDEAKVLYDQGLQGLCRIWGNDHPETEAWVEAIVYHLRQQRKHDEARILEEELALT